MGLTLFQYWSIISLKRYCCACLFFILRPQKNHLHLHSFLPESVRHNSNINCHFYVIVYEHLSRSGAAQFQSLYKPFRPLQRILCVDFNLIDSNVYRYGSESQYLICSRLELDRNIAYFSDDKLVINSLQQFQDIQTCYD